MRRLTPQWAALSAAIHHRGCAGSLYRSTTTTTSTTATTAAAASPTAEPPSLRRDDGDIGQWYLNLWGLVAPPAAAAATTTARPPNPPSSSTTPSGSSSGSAHRSETILAAQRTDRLITEARLWMAQGGGSSSGGGGSLSALPDSMVQGIWAIFNALSGQCAALTVLSKQPQQTTASASRKQIDAATSIVKGRMEQFFLMLGQMNVAVAHVQDLARKLSSVEDGAILSLQQQDALFRTVQQLRDATTPLFEKWLRQSLSLPNGLVLLFELRLWLLKTIDAAEKRLAAKPTRHNNPESGSAETKKNPEGFEEVRTTVQTLQRVDASLFTILREIFATDRLELQELSWSSTPPAVMEAIMKAESVHPFVNGLTDFQSRVRQGLPPFDPQLQHVKSLPEALTPAGSREWTVEDGLRALTQLGGFSAADETRNNNNNAHTTPYDPSRTSTPVESPPRNNRHMFALMHAKLPGMPLVAVQVAITPRIENSVDRVLGRPVPSFLDDSAREEHKGGDALSPSRNHAAMFYSINVIQPALKGIDLGATLIKKVWKELQLHPTYYFGASSASSTKGIPAEAPTMLQGVSTQTLSSGTTAAVVSPPPSPLTRAYSTLSPIPGYIRWLRNEVSKLEQGKPHHIFGARCSPDATSAWFQQLREAFGATQPRDLLEEEILFNVLSLTEPDALVQAVPTTEGGDSSSSIPPNLPMSWCYDREFANLAALREPLLRSVVHYLVGEKRRGRALDPVAHFHLGNGATLYRVNWLGNCTYKGAQESLCITANYRYEADVVWRNQMQYAKDGTIAVGEMVQRYL